MLYLLAICYVCQVITKRYAGSFVTRDLGGGSVATRTDSQATD